MTMPSFDNLFVYNIFLLGKDGRGASSLGSPASLPFHKDDENIIALMATTTKSQRPQERKRRLVAPLLEMLYDLLRTLKDGRISWLLLPGEKTPSTIIIHKDLTTEILIQLATWRLTRLGQVNMARNRFSTNYLNELKESRQHAREQAADVSLGNSEPLAAYLEQAYPPRAVEPQRTLSSTASIVINLPTETIFAYLSDPRHVFFGQEDSEGQSEEVKLTYRFFGIPISFNGLQIQVKEIHQLTPDPIGLGTLFEQSGTLHGRIHKSKIQITEYEPPKSITFTYSPTLMRYRLILTPTHGNTRLTLTLTLGGGRYPFIEFIWTSMVKQDLQKGLKHLKATLERLEA
jgi:uncharacterized protein YndB with AHSA1/START domain